MRLYLLVTIVVVFVVSGAALFFNSPIEAQIEPLSATDPNILYIVLDDADAENMNKYMPKTQALVKDQGADFSNFYVAQAMCCPSRSSALLGEYPHNHKVERNTPPEGGWRKFKSEGHESRTIGVGMQQARYSTGFFGKYMNGYKHTKFVPKGWDTWFANGHMETHIGHEYNDKIVMNRSTNWVETNTEPFFAYVSPKAPHSPYVDPPGHQATPKEFVRAPSFNEADVSDKPPYVRDSPMLDDAGAKAVAERHIYRAKMTEFLDNKISQMIAALETTGKLENTYVVVTSDNGWAEGEHRLPMGKADSYEESTHLPLWVRGPGITPGTVIEEPTSNIDLFATFEDIAGQDPDLRDGLSLLPRLRNEGTIDRQRVLIEGAAGRSDDFNAIFDVSHEGRKLKYVEYVDGAKELYDLDVDPYELQSLHETADSALLADLSEDLATMKNCSGHACRTASSNP